MIEPCTGLRAERTFDGKLVLRWHYSSDPDLTPERVQALRQGFSSESIWNMEMEIDPWAMSGARVYPEFNIHTHVIPNKMVPARMTRYMSIDPHPRTPHALLWLGVDEFGDYYAYREFWPSVVCGQNRHLKDTDLDNSYTTKDYAELIALAEGNVLRFIDEGTARERGRYIKRPYGERIYLRYMDQAGKGFRATGEDDTPQSYAWRYQNYGIYCSDPRKRVKDGINTIHTLLAPRKHELYGDWPRLHIAESCRELIFEFENYRYEGTRIVKYDKELKQVGVEARCHMLDNLRYISLTNPSYIRSCVS
jgi:hypothetical protein